MFDFIKNFFIKDNFHLKHEGDYYLSDSYGYMSLFKSKFKFQYRPYVSINVMTNDKDNDVYIDYIIYSNGHIVDKFRVKDIRQKYYCPDEVVRILSSLKPKENNNYL